MKKKIALWVLVGIAAAVLLLRAVWIHIPCEGTVVYYVQETGVTVEERLTPEETAAVRKALFGKIRWSEELYGYPACGFGSIYAVILDGVCYMPAWDSCGMVAVKDTASDDGAISYINVTQNQKAVFDEIICSRGDNK